MAGEQRLSPQPPPAVLGVVAATFVAGVVLRIWVLGSPLGDVDIDEATMGLQAQAFLDGHPAVFFPTQGYGGTAETALVAAAFAVFGEGWLALKRVALVLHLAAAVLTWRAACRLTSSTLGRLTPPMLLWVGSAYGIWESTKARGFYGVAIVLAAAVLLLVARLHEHPSRIDMAGLGLCLGLAALDHAAPRSCGRAPRRLAGRPPAGSLAALAVLGRAGTRRGTAIHRVEHPQ